MSSWNNSTSSWNNSTSSWNNSKNSWSPWYLTIGIIVGGSVTIIIMGCIVAGISSASITYCRKRPRRRSTAITTARTVTTTNLPEGTCPIQQGVSYTATQDGTPLMSEPMSVQQKIQPQSMADSMQVPPYDSSSPDTSTQEPDSPPHSYLPEGTCPIQQGVSYTATQDGTPLMSEPMSVQQKIQPQSMADSMQVPPYDSSPDTSTQEPDYPPPSYDQLYP